MGVLTVESDDPDNPVIAVNLVRNGLPSAVVSQAIALEAAIDDAIAVGSLIGSGNGSSSHGRNGAFIDMVEAAGDLIEAGLSEEACGQLRSALRRVDGHPRPPDFMVGDDAAIIAEQIEALRTSLECG